MPRYKKYKVVVDFDGVIHAYTSPWTHSGEVLDGPTPGAIPWLKEMLAHEDTEVILNTARLAGGSKNAQVAVYNWLLNVGMTPEEVDRIQFAVGKPHGTLYIDDRGYRFRGRFPTLEDFDAHKQWNHADPKEVLRHDLQEVLKTALHRSMTADAIDAVLDDEVQKFERWVLGQKRPAAE